MGKVLTGVGITAHGNGPYSMIGGDELSDAKRDTLLELCRKPIDGFQELQSE
jgi:hypothetical protein